MDIHHELAGEFGTAVEVRSASAADGVDGIVPTVVAAPVDESAATALVAWCGSNNQAVVVRGGGTKLGLGARPARCDVILSTQYLNTVIEHDEGNATVNAQAGIGLDELNRQVGLRGQYVPLDRVSVDAPGTLGGIVACNYTGMSKLKYGAPRDLVVGLDAALSDGRLVRAGSKVVKNVSGYDLNKIFVGSLGTLGLLTRVTLRLRPRDAATCWWSCPAAPWAQAEATATEILDGAFEPTVLRVETSSTGATVLARFDGGNAAVKAQLERLQQLGCIMDTAPDTVELRGVYVLAATMPLRAAAMWARLAHDCGCAGLTWDVGAGSVRAVFAVAPDVAALRTAAQAAGGFLVVQSAPPEAKSAAYVWGPSRPDFALMQRLKQAYDPAGVCCPGRLVLGA